MDQPTTTYKLNASERQTLLDLNTNRAQQKVAIHDLNMQLEKAQKERDAADALFAGALAMLANGQKMLPGAQVSPDFTVLTGVVKADE